MYAARMDFLDPQKQKEHARRLILGYILIGVLLLLATVVLLHQVYGFGVDKSGNVFQKGLVFLSSQPDGADIFINDKKYKDGTNTRMTIPAGQYVVELKKNGYRDWKRALTVEGGSVMRFDYPMLFPNTLTTTTTKQYAAAPSLATESLDNRWLLIGASDQNSFDLFDLNSKEVTVKSVAVPVQAMAAGSATKGWQAIEWADDNRHVVLKRLYEKSGTLSDEYILFDREEPNASRNLSVTLGITPTTLTLRSGDYDRYYLHNQTTGQLLTAELKKPTPQLYISGVITFASEGNTVLYATADGAPSGKVLVQLRHAEDRAYTVRQAPSGTTYLIDMAEYDNKIYVAAGAQNEDSVSVYEDPLSSLEDRPETPVAPKQILKLTAPNYVAFSEENRFVAAESGDRFAVYDAETDNTYAYQAKAPLDAPQVHAHWMDGFRLSYVSGGNLVVFDYDGNNLQSLMPASSNFIPFFERDFRYAYTLTPGHALTSTALRLPEDL